MTYKASFIKLLPCDDCNADLVYDIGLGSDVQDHGQGFRAVFAIGDGPSSEGSCSQTRSRASRQ